MKKEDINEVLEIVGGAYCLLIESLQLRGIKESVIDCFREDYKFVKKTLLECAKEAKL